MAGRPRTRSIAGEAGSLVLVLSGVLLLLLSPVRGLVGQWQQHQAAIVQDRHVFVYRNALDAAYAALADPIEDELVTFSQGAVPVLPTATADEVRSTSALRRFAQVRIRIPSIGLDQAVVEGVSVDALRRGPGHYPGTALPGALGNAVISGHRTTYSRPFALLDRLGPGDLIFLDTPEGTFPYEVERTLVVSPAEVGPLLPSSYAKLTLTTCNPPGSARERLVVEARLAGTPG